MFALVVAADVMRLPLDLANARSQSLDTLGHGCREEGDASALRCLSEDFIDIIDEAHPKHLIRLIEDD